MAELSMFFDASEFEVRTAELKIKMEEAKIKALEAVSDELLRLSQQEVPFETGELMSSGVSQQNGDEYVVGYNKVYAAYMHEGHWLDGSHVILNYHNGRKGHYLIDPMLLNRPILEEYFRTKLQEVVGI